MNALARVTRNTGFIKGLWRNRVALRNLIADDNLLFIRDFPPGHFYSPLPDAREIRGNARNLFDRSVKSLDGIRIGEAEQLRLLSTFALLYRDFALPITSTAGFRYWLDNPYFSFGDGIILYCFLKHFQPKRVVEVGSGFSSAEMLDIRERFMGNNLELSFIEPYPERLNSLMYGDDRGATEIQVASVQSVDPVIFTSLEENDILFVDSSHIGKIGSDVLHIIYKILPLLGRGVIIHFHDILWPFEYPKEWFEQGRAWNEAYFLRAFLQFNPAFEILYFNSFMEIHHADAMRQSLPLALKPPSSAETLGNSSLWLRKVL